MDGGFHLGTEERAAQDSVVAHLRSLEAYILQLSVQQEHLRAVPAQLHAELQAAICGWSEISEQQAKMGVALVVESCGVVISILQFLRSDLGLGPKDAPYSSAFVVLTCSVHAFLLVRDIPDPGQVVQMQGLTSAAGQLLNGCHGTVMSFHPPSGRFIVRLKDGDPPSAYKRIRALNLAAGENGGLATLNGHKGSPRDHGLACLESIADVFDELLQDMQVDAANWDSTDDRLVEADLAASMWEALLCCSAGRFLDGASFLELCGDVSVCSLLTRYVLSAHFGPGPDRPYKSIQGVQRLLRVQETLVRCYYGLFQPAGFWTPEGMQTNDVPIAKLEENFDSHLTRMADLAVNLAVVPRFIHAVEFHVHCARNAPEVPIRIALLVLLSRFLCTVLQRTSRLTCTFNRHVLLQASSVVSVVDTFVQMVTSRLADGSCIQPVEELIIALRAAVDILVVLSGELLHPQVLTVLWGCGEFAILSRTAVLNTCVGSITSALLATPQTASDAAILARLAVVLTLQPHEFRANLVAACSGLPQPSQELLWRHLHVCARHCRAPDEVRQQAQEWLGAVLAPPAQPESPEATWEQMVQAEMRELDTLFVEYSDEKKGPTLGVLDLPLLPGQKPAGQAAIDTAPAPEKQQQQLTRQSLGRIRGVDPATAPQELRCAIDGQVVCEPVRSPHGHLFERSTLEKWIGLCGSVCPVTGKPLRMNECTEDKNVEAQVLAWANECKAQHKRQAQERKDRRRAKGRKSQPVPDEMF